MMATGGGGVEIDRVGVRAERLDQHVVDDLDDHLAGRDRLDHVGADGPVAHLVDKGAHHVERHVGFCSAVPGLKGTFALIPKTAWKFAGFGGVMLTGITTGRYT